MERATTKEAKIDELEHEYYGLLAPAKIRRINQ